MDRTHEAFYRVAFDLPTADAATAAQAIAAFEAHAVEHFELEERWMRETEFPARDCHAEDHAAVLASVREVRDALAEQRAGAELLHRLAEQLFAWFPGHADYLDSALAAWISRPTLGGQPVVLRRSLR